MGVIQDYHMQQIVGETVAKTAAKILLLGFDSIWIYFKVTDQLFHEGTYTTRISIIRGLYSAARTS